MDPHSSHSPPSPLVHDRIGPRGAVSSTHHLGTAAAASVLARGGNAFDAAVTCGFVLQVVEPHLCGPGGELPAVLVTAADPVPRVLCAQGVAPAAASIDRLRRAGCEIVPGTGLLPATVPGAWDGWLSLLRDHGTWELADVLEPALGYAAGGFPLVPRIPDALAVVAEHFRTHWPSSAATWLPGGRVPRAGEIVRLPALAATWQRLLGAATGPDREARIDAARDAWYRGFVAEEIERFCATPVRDETGRDHTGLLTADDLARWSAHYEDAVVADAGRGWSVAKCGPWSQGPVLLQQLRLLSGTDLELPGGVASEGTVHTAAEAAKLAFADREAWYGDPAGGDVPLAELLSDDYTAARRALIGSTSDGTLRPGSPAGRRPRIGAYAARPGAGRGTGVQGPGTGEPTVSREGVARGDTVHVDVVDAAGNMISVTPSGGWLQSSPTIPALGFCLGTRGQMFWLEEGLPSSMAPGRMPRTTLSPSLALRDGEPAVALGTPGGDQQDQWQLCLLLAMIHGELDLQAAIDAPAWHSTAFPASFAPRGWEPHGLVVESRLGADTLAGLRRRGHDVVDAGNWALGRMCAVGRGSAVPGGGGPGALHAAVDPRSGVGAAIAV
ncbi:gamma-glutamyltranspeptidase / glutathione hydrolase [Pseudonocardia ammonioxydans]|uniref:Gamma-glutamyltranspeptidase / glutathione hydrolase n=1 Tax=Pseudonocardia ammonioxydans TaxID=260086 RepID=A0A1I4WWE0_PSUAM|nr:gamma-glutamyltranspeptidase / glutathione hydrolase [Pseudonocardia ammonioxydans]